MKWSFALPLLAASSALAASTNAIAARRAQVLAARQAHVERGLLDICISISGDLNLLNILPGGKPLIFADLNTCLCLGALPTFVNAFLQVKGGIAGVGQLQLVSALSAYILSHPTKQSCDFPLHCQPHGANGGLLRVRGGNQGCSNPCAFDCIDGYTAVGNKCVCTWPKKECNGQCGYYPQGCGASQAPQPWKRNVPMCSSGRQLCGVVGGSSGKGWECIDTKTDLESCGGCIIPSPFGNEIAGGKDCSNIPHASTVSCNQGACVVSACAHGFIPSPFSDSCVPVAVEKRQPALLARGGGKPPAHLFDLDAFFRLFASLKPILEASLSGGVHASVGRRGKTGDLFDLDAFFKLFASLKPIFEGSLKGGIDAHILKRGDLDALLEAAIHLEDLLKGSLDASVKGSLLERGGKSNHDLLDLEAFIKACLSLKGILNASVTAGVKGSILRRGGQPKNLVDISAFLDAFLKIADLLKGSLNVGVKGSIL